MNKEKENLKFVNGLIFNNEIQCYLFPINSFLCILNELINKNDTETKIIEKLKKSSKIDSEIILENLNFKQTNIHKLKSYVEFINSLGMGKIELKTFSSEKILFHLKKNILSLMYTKLYNEKPRIDLEYILVGYLENFASKLLKKEVTATLIKKNQENSLISITITENKINLKPTKYYYEIPQKKYETSNTLKKIINGKHIHIEKGTFSIWNMFCVLCPYFYFIELTKENKNENEQFFKNLGRMQGKAATDIQTQIYGIKGKKVFLSVIEQSEISAMGKIDILNKNPLQFKIINNLASHFNNFYKYEEFVNFMIYFENNIKGVYETSFNKKTEIIKKKGIVTLKIISEKDIGKFSDEEKNINKIIKMKSLITKSSLQ